MKHKLVIFGAISLGLLYLYMEGRNELLKIEIEKLKTQKKLSEEELNYAFSMLTQEEKKMVFGFYERNHKFYKQVFPT